MSDTANATGIESSMQENRLFPPDPAKAKLAWISSREQYEKMYRHSIEKPEEFWAKAAEELHWFAKWNQVLDWKPPHAKWFVGAKTNVAYNCLDAQIAKGRGDKTAILWEGELIGSDGKPEIRRLSFRQLTDEVCRFANGLKKLGVKKGDRITIYMPMTPEAAVAMLACARIGATHSVIFGGFSSQAIVDRVEDAKSTLIITADGGYRRGSVVALKQNVDDALKKTDLVKRVIVLEHAKNPVNWVDGRDIGWSAVVEGQSTDCPAEPMERRIRFMCCTPAARPASPRESFTPPPVICSAFISRPNTSSTFTRKMSTGVPPMSAG